MRFWSGYLDYVRERGADTRQSPNPKGWLTHSVGCAGFVIVVSVRPASSVTGRDELRVALVANGPNAHTDFDQLLSHRAAIEEQLGDELAIRAADGVRQRSLSIAKETDLDDENLRADDFEWLWGWVTEFKRVFEPVLREI